MDDRQAVKLRMYLNVQHVLRRNQPVWESVAAYARSFESLNRNLETINGLNTQRQLSSKGITLNKSQAKELMTDKAMVLVGAMRALASVTSDAVLSQDAAFSRSALLQSRDTDADDVCQRLHTLAQVRLTALGDFGITQSDLDALQAAIQQFTAVIGKPQDTIAQVKSINEQIEACFRENDKILNEQLDNLMPVFKATQPIFYSEYFSARTLGS